MRWRQRRTFMHTSSSGAGGARPPHAARAESYRRGEPSPLGLLLRDRGSVDLPLGVPAAGHRAPLHDRGRGVDRSHVHARACTGAGRHRLHGSRANHPPRRGLAQRLPAAQGCARGRMESTAIPAGHAAFMTQDLTLTIASSVSLALTTTHLTQDAWRTECAGPRAVPVLTLPPTRVSQCTCVPHLPSSASCSACVPPASQGV